ncbi:hypothetical protein E4T49_05664 [Aureobasidium sp. EXF-10728]|nr:hypothetical protein E4T49_05664 [Aureobasidium sp. EXF-10728]
MSEWRDRGYVPDSDEDEVSLVDDAEDDKTTTTTRETPRATTTPDHRCASVELVDDVETDRRDRVDRALDPRNEPQGPVQTSEEDITFDIPQGNLDAQQTIPKPSAGQPIVLITQSRGAESPSEINRNVKTYSRRFRPGALKRIKSTVNVSGPTEQTTQEDDGFMDIDTLVEENVDPEQAPSSSAPLIAPSQAERRLSVSSSDLSDVDMQLISSPQPFFIPSTSTARTNDSIPRLPGQPETTALDGAVISLSDEHDTGLAAHPSRRNLRARKAIQVHPYALEIEEYRRRLRAVGVRPIQIATHSQRPRDQDDSQDAEFHQEESQPRHRQPEHTQESTPPESSASSTHSQRPPLDLSNVVAGDEDEFPDLDTIRRRVQGATQIRNKRRKTLETPHAETNRYALSSSTARARGRLKSLNLNRVQSITNGSFNQDLLPPSPPRTSSPANAEPTLAAPPRFRLPHGHNPAAVPTPLPSSPEPPALTSVRRPRQVVISSDDDDAVNRQDAGVELSPSSESDQENRQLMRMRRKIRGVLPASYLKLDRQVRQPSPSVAPSEVQIETPRPTAPVRGVAQRRVTSTSATPAHQNSYVVFSDNSDSESSLAELTVPRLLQTTLPSPITGRPSGRPFETSDVDEQDEIDDMFPTSGRNHFRLPGSKRQSKLPATFTRTKSSSEQAHTGQKRKATNESAARKSTSHHKPSTNVKRKTAAKKPRPVQLSILDATTSTESKSPRAVPKPQFVRLAARQARNRSDHGRQSPTNKEIRLATREDTQDALEPLLSWRAGKLNRSWAPPPQDARSVGDIRNNERVRDAEASNDSEGPVVTRGSEHRRPGQPRPVVGARPRQPQQLQEGGNDVRKRTSQSVLRANQRKLLERDHRMRPAQLESVAQATHRDLDPLTFAAPPSRLMEIFARDQRDQPASKFRLERFLKDKNDFPGATVPNQMQDQDTHMTGTDNVPSPARARKRLARRFDVETTRFRQPNEPLPVEIPSISAQDPEAVQTDGLPKSEILQGLGPFGTRYPTDFDVRPLEIGTYFATSTFVGSGDFNDCLTLRKRDLDVPAGRITVEVAGRSLHWSAWNEDVSAGLVLILTACTEDLHAVGEFETADMRRTAIEDVTARFNYFLRSVVRYLSGCLHFLDTIDRSSCLSRLSRFVDEFVDMIEMETIVLKAHPDIRTHVDRLIVDSLLYLLCVTVQSVRISQHPATDFRLQTLLVDKCVRLSTKVVAAALPSRLTAVRDFLETHREHAHRDSGIQEQDVAIKSIVIINHALLTVNASVKLSEIITTHQIRAISTIYNIHSLDQIWSEAETQYAAAKFRGLTEISPEMLEMTITTNQRSIFAILQDLLLAMLNAVKVSKSWSKIRNIIEQSNLIEVLKLFDMDQPRLSVAIIQTLDIVDELLLAKNRLSKPVQQDSQPGSDDSQDYGDWSFMDQVLEEPENSAPKVSEVTFLQEPIASLLSTCFGSEKGPDDALLKKVVDVWTATAQHLIKDNVLDWSSFLNVYSTTSWFQLRETEQRHKYTCYFLATVIKSDKSSLINHRILFMKAWFVSLFERESMLKFQHRLTASLLEKATSEPLLHNLPFAADYETGEYRITMAEFRQRRISLIGSVLSNMHTLLNSIHSSAISESKREYVDMLKAAMQHMRGTYEQLQNMSGRLGGSSYDNVKGAYVEFVQSIVSLMQQYTSDICPIDPFFVDSAAFPLPLDDPTYVKAKLKSYDSKLQDSRARKQLAVFVQTVSERAASEKQQPYLIKQMHDALTGNASRGLRSVVLTALLPAYIECSYTSARGWYLATPLVDASAMVIYDMIFDLDFIDQTGMGSDVSAVTSALAAAYRFTMSISSSPTSRDNGFLRLLVAIFGLVEQSLTFVEYVHRATGKASDAMELLHRLVAFGEKFSARIMESIQEALESDLSVYPDEPMPESVYCSWQDTLDFATRSLSESLARTPTRNWDMDLESVEIESMRVVAAVELLRRSYNIIIPRRESIVQSAVDEDESEGDEGTEEEEQEMERQGLDGLMNGMQGLGWAGLM